MFGLHLVKGVRPELFEMNEWDFFVGNIISSQDTRNALPKWSSSDRKEVFNTYM